MLVLTRKLNQQISLGDNIKVTVLQIGKGCIRLGVEAPRGVKILRTELQEWDQPASASRALPSIRSIQSESEEPLKTVSFTNSQSLTEEAFSMLEIDVESFAAELLEAEQSENELGLTQGANRLSAQLPASEKASGIHCEETIDGVVYQTRRSAPLSRFVRSTVRETDIAYSLF